MKIPPEQVSPSVKRVLPARAVASRYGIHLRSISRWIARGIIPLPTRTINGRRYWLSEVLDAADRQHTAEAAAGIKSDPNSAVSCE
jgi:hypothetical protein